MTCFSHSQNKGEKIVGLSPALRAAIFQSAYEYCRVAPNADFDATGREIIRSAFFRIRVWTKKRGLRGSLHELDIESYKLGDC